MQYDVCIIGAGPAGLIASIFASQAGSRCAIIEKNTTAGRKLLRTGHGRCNLTHQGSVPDFVSAYDSCGKFLRHCLYEFSADAVREFFARIGLATKVEAGACVFPITDRAADVARVLVDCARRQHVVFLYGRIAQTIEHTGEGSFLIRAGKDDIFAKALIIATGGLSYSFTGSTGDGYRFAQSLGHTIIPPCPALVGLITKQDWPSLLQGIGLPDVRISTSLAGRKITSSGPMMFTDSGIGGPAVFDISRHITRHLAAPQNPAENSASSQNHVEIVIDMLPSTDSRQLEELIVSRTSHYGKRELAGIFTAILPRAAALDICRRLDPDKIIMANQLTTENRRALIGLIKSADLTITSTAPVEEATITQGGVSTEQIDDKTMQSLLCKGLFFAGEVIDADGPCGGYNLQIAWSTGALAGRSAAKSASAG